MNEQQTVVAVVAAFFAVMGVFALVWPSGVMLLFGTRDLNANGRNEVRAVYGGFGLAAGGLLLATLFGPNWGPGVQLAFAVSLFGMAAGRIISLAIDHQAGLMPWTFFLTEVALGGALIYAFLQPVLPV